LFRSDIQNGHIYISYSFQLTWSEVMCASLGICGSCVVPFQNCVRHPCNVYSGFFSEIFLSADLYWWCKLGIFDKRSNLNHFLWNCRTKFGRGGPSDNLYRLGILWGEKNQIKIFYSEIWDEMIFGWPIFKIMCDTPWAPWVQDPGSL
jgi:hypothetical protein